MKRKRVLVTGSGTGVGRGIALAFAKQGADVAFHYSHSKDGAEAAAEQARKMGANAKAFQADLAHVSQVKKIAQEAIGFLGGLDTLVNNAGISMTLPFESVTVEQYELLYKVNVEAMFFLIQACLPTLAKSDNASVINISSVHALRGQREFSVYAGTKGAIISLSRQLAIELATQSIRVNVVILGGVAVENHYKNNPGYNPEADGRKIPVGFLAKPEDVADVMVFLASDQARYITAQEMVVDGGATSCLLFSEDFRKSPGISLGKGYVPGL